jgi:hypothetical protein
MQALQIVGKQEIWAVGTTGTNAIFVEHADGEHWQLFSVPAVPEAHPLDVTIFGASRDKVWVVEQAFVYEHASDPHMKTTCQTTCLIYQSVLTPGASPDRRSGTPLHEDVPGWPRTTQWYNADRSPAFLTIA